MNIQIKNCKIPVGGKFICKDIFINGDKITFDGNLRIDKVIDAEGCYALPGFIDIHTHLDDYIGKYYLADTYRSASEIALRNGFTTLFNFITQKPSEDLYSSISEAEKKVTADCGVNFYFHLTPVEFTDNDFKKFDNLIQRGFRTFKFYTTYRQSGLYCSYLKLDEIFSRLSGYDIRVLIHCEDDDVLSRHNPAEINLANAFSHSLMRPPEAEITAIEKVLDLAIKYSVPLHIVHVSTPEGAKMIYNAKLKYDFISCETCPQYLLLDDSILKKNDGYRYICSPPLRSRESADEMIRLANEEYFDIYTTDHCAFSKKDKDENKDDISRVPNGLPGIGGLVHNIYNILKGTEEEKLLHITKHLSKIPALLTGIYPEKGTLQEGSKADIVILKPGKQHKIKSSLSDVYDPYENFSSELYVTYTISEGRIYDF
jgi:dihydropyrimidinase